MISSTKFTKRVLQPVFMAAILMGIASAQSGRSMMEGFVVGESDWPGLNGALVELIGDPDSPRLRSVKLTTKTDGVGKYSLTDIPHGDYTLRVSAPGYIAYQINIYLLSDTMTQLHVRLRKGKASIKDREEQCIERSTPHNSFNADASIVSF